MRWKPIGCSARKLSSALLKNTWPMVWRTLFYARRAFKVKLRCWSSFDTYGILEQYLKATRYGIFWDLLMHRDIPQWQAEKKKMILGTCVANQMASLLYVKKARLMKRYGDYNLIPIFNFERPSLSFLFRVSRKMTFPSNVSNLKYRGYNIMLHLRNICLSKCHN